VLPLFPVSNLNLVPDRLSLKRLGLLGLEPVLEPEPKPNLNNNAISLIISLVPTL
jgi:hypothetical protein